MKITNSRHNNHRKKEEVSGAILINFALKIKSSQPPCTAACAPPAPVLDRPPPSTHLGHLWVRLVSHKLRGECLIYLPFTTEISQKNTQQ